MYDGSKDITKRYLRHLLTLYDLSTGIFLKSDPTYPVSWGIYGDMGHAVGLYTLPEYRHNQIALSININLFTQLEQEGLVPVVDVQRKSAIAGPLGRAEKYIADSTFRDSITGECY